MKIYIVSAGSYSDYHIEKLFSNKDKAEEYADWLEDSNDVEEYEVDDITEYKKYYKIIVNIKYHDNGKCDFTYHTCKTVDNWCAKGDTSISDYHKYNGDYISLYLNRLVESQNYNEEFYKNKYTKAAYDLLATVRQKISEGFNTRDINELLNS